ncbi:glycosyltransferase family A protein [uncultured Polaribacter sp.]|uniref:glycosyltransferase family 2 protein n=1 Tax=uncultured Polaribacter sp. TaxID=174711 RepID=UPI00261C49E2|nr:glycosyltransferase family A protein [uncultured Polaribacter sp.]
MLSVLIPTYNYNAFPLVTELHQQLVLENISFEIICFDDGSKASINKENEAINTLSYAVFKSLETNIGRSAIRNLLAKTAQYNWLLFLDADVKPANKNFIKTYISCCKERKHIFCGGILYEAYSEHKKLLRYSYGKKHEEIAIAIRKQRPDKYFFTANFLIHKKAFNTVLFDEQLTKYGYEDLIFAKEIEKSSCKIVQIENEIYHLGIDSNESFVNKTAMALRNLNFLLKQNQLSFSDTNLTRAYFKLKRFKLTFLLNFNWKNVAIQSNSLVVFNAFRLSYLHQILKNSK